MPNLNDNQELVCISYFEAKPETHYQKNYIDNSSVCG